MKRLLVLIAIVSTSVAALTPEAEKGEQAIVACMSCHNPELTPALAPPFFGVQNRYTREYSDKAEFISAIVNWVKQPTMDKALMRRPVRELGLMPAMPLPDEMLVQIAAYLYEKEFEPPCTHWASDIAKGNKDNHTRMVEDNFNNLCKE